MRLIIQRVTSASVSVENEVVGQIAQGLLVFLGIKKNDTENMISYLVDKLIHLRIFSDDEEKMNRSLLDTKGSLLLISQFTLYGDCSKGRRPAFIDAAIPEQALELYHKFQSELEAKLGKHYVQTGKFGAKMEVHLVNDGPVTFLLEKD